MEKFIIKSTEGDLTIEGEVVGNLRVHKPFEFVEDGIVYRDVGYIISTVTGYGIAFSDLSLEETIEHAKVMDTFANWSLPPLEVGKTVGLAKKVTDYQIEHLTKMEAQC